MKTTAPTSENSVLVLVDVQGKLALSMFDRARLLANARRLLQSAPALAMPVAVLEQVPDKLGPTLAVLANDLRGAPVFAKRTFSARGQPEFMAHLEALQRNHVVLAGIESHVCVYQTVRDLQQEGYTVRVVADAVSSRTEQNHRYGLEMCRAAGGTITTTESVLFELMGSVDHPAFRTILQQVR